MKDVKGRLSTDNWQTGTGVLVAGERKKNLKKKERKNLREVVVVSRTDRCNSGEYCGTIFLGKKEVLCWSTNECAVDEGEKKRVEEEVPK